MTIRSFSPIEQHRSSQALLVYRISPAVPNLGKACHSNNAIRFSAILPSRDLLTDYRLLRMDPDSSRAPISTTWNLNFHTAIYVRKTLSKPPAVRLPKQDNPTPKISPSVLQEKIPSQANSPLPFPKKNPFRLTFPNPHESVKTISTPSTPSHPHPRTPNLNHRTPSHPRSPQNSGLRAAHPLYTRFLSTTTISCEIIVAESATVAGSVADPTARFSIGIEMQVTAMHVH
ncbi:hypothetical protein CC78DRAFT_528110 [Lojkania enalia]|uniref:Uncharacterized protein n=1 Tax=Lojkania enalia TaxID=147567 RepID=A0A9P4NDM2_9PLEO|nr:hypothetical protein CC78DRAFT_528110 [Didymosphaeria enalia]